jgi:hypothetical protein
MWRWHFIRNLRTALFIAAALSLFALGTIVWWANRTGLPENWRSAIEEECGKQGTFLTIDSLSYIPFKGIIASGVRVFSDKEKRLEVSQLERVVLDFDKAELIRKKFRLTKVELSDARLSMPLDPRNPESTRLEVTGLNGTVLMPGGRLLEARDVRGKIAGIDVIFGARMLGYQQKEGEHKEDPNEAKRREVAARFIRELEKWTFDDSRPPVLRIFAEGDLSDKSTINARISLQATEMEKNGHVLDQINARATLIGNLLTLTSLHAVDDRGVLEARVDYDIHSGEGRFEMTSGLEIPGLLKSWADLPSIPQITFGGSQKLEAVGSFKLRQDAPPDVNVTGNAQCDSVMMKGVAFDTVQTAFSWNDGNLYLLDTLLTRKDGVASGKALIQGPIVQMALRSTLPSEVYLPFFIGQPLETVINDFGKLPGAKVDVELEGGFDTREKSSWAYTGKGQVDNVTFKGVPVAMASCSFDLSHHALDFHSGTVVFNYDNYGLRNAYGGPNRGTTKVGRIRYDPEPRHVEIEGVEGTMWAAPLVRLFAPELADDLEDYRFHSPPTLKGSGVVDVTPQGRTNLTVSFSSEKAADYKCLGQSITLFQPRGQVLIRGNQVTVDDLTFRAFGGPVSSRFEFHKGRLGGEVSWTKVGLPEVASTYGFQMEGGGTTTGRIEFTCTNGKIETLDGTGLLGLEKAELFSVPIFGPLSKLVAAALGDRRAGHERAKDAFLNFQIHRGVLSSNDFRTSTSSLVFTGDGSIDLATRDIDMTVRMNARGFLGLITLPLRPFYGLFQFHGTGPMRNTDWKSELFTAPPKDQEDTLLNPPKARSVAETLPATPPPRARAVRE